MVVVNWSKCLGACCQGLGVSFFKDAKDRGKRRAVWLNSSKPEASRVYHFQREP